MPFDFIKLQPYRINYKQLFDGLKNAPLLDNQKLKEEYLNYWLTVLKEHDKTAVKAFDTPEKIKNYQKQLLAFNEKEIFQQVFTFEPTNVNVYFHFRISIISHILSNNNQEVSPVQMELNEFSNKESHIKWSRVPIDEKQEFNSEPIFLVPFLNGKFNYLLIDGNHRVSHALDLGKEHIQGLPFSERSIIDFQLLCNSFDSLLYIFYNEMNHFANNKNRYHSTDQELLNKSYLAGNGFQF